MHRMATESIRYEADLEFTEDIPCISKMDLIHKSHNAPIPYPTMLHSEQNITFSAAWKR